MCGNGSQTGAGAWVVLIFWPNFRLAVLIYSGGAYKKSVYFNQHMKKILNFHYAWLKYRSRNARVEVKLKFNHTEIAFEL